MQDLGCTMFCTFIYLKETLLFTYKIQTETYRKRNYLTDVTTIKVNQQFSFVPWNHRC